MEWVLRHSYALERLIILATMNKILATDNFTIEQNNVVARVLEWYGQGLDFADALHLASSLQADQFVSFDKKLIKIATELNMDIIFLEP